MRGVELSFLRFAIGCVQLVDVSIPKIAGLVLMRASVAKIAFFQPFRSRFQVRWS